MKKLIVLPFLLYASILLAQPKFLIPYREGNLWGYADTNFNVVVTPQYNEASIFVSGYAWVQKNYLSGVVNNQGEEVIPPQYDKFERSTENFFIVSKNQLHGIIKYPKGEVVLPVIYGGLSRTDDNFIVSNANYSLYGVFNIKTKSWLLPLEYDRISIEYPWFIATKNNIAVYYKVDASSNLSKARPPKSQPIKKKAVKTKTRVFDEGPLEELQLSKEFKMDTSTLLENQRVLEQLQRGNKFGYYLYVKKNGLVIKDSIPAVYDSINFWKARRGLLVVKQDGKEGIITDENKVIVPLIWETIRSVYLAAEPDWFVVSKDGKKGVITSQNNVLVPIVYDDITEVDSTLVHGIFIVKNNGKYGLARGEKLLVPCTFDRIEVLSDWKERFTLYRDLKQGAFLYSKKDSIFDVFIPADYDYILYLYGFHPSHFDASIPYSEDFKNKKFLLYISKDNKRGYVDLNGREYFKD